MTKELSQRTPGLLGRRTFLGAVPLLLGMAAQTRAQELGAMEKIRASGVLKVALYKDNAPYSEVGGTAGMRGVDASLAQALAKQLGLTVSYLPFDAGETMGDDLRNMVWKGHYLGYGPADVMLHVPVDKYFMADNRQAFIFAPYSREHLVLLRDPARLAQVDSASDLVGHKVNVELGTGASSALLGFQGGVLSDRIVLYKDGVAAARQVLAGQGDAAYVTLAQAESAIFAAGAKRSDWAFSELALPGVPPNGWALGMAVKADNKELAQLLDKGLDTLRQSGELLALFQAHGLTLAAP